MKWNSTLCRALQSAIHLLSPQWELPWNARTVGDKRCKSGILVVLCWGSLICWQWWIRFTSSPKLASPKLNKAVLLCNSFFMSAANPSYCWPKVLSQSPGNFYWITLIILIKMCRGEKAFTSFRLKVSFERINGIIFVAFKIPLCHVSVCTSLGEFKIALALSTAKGSLQCACNALLQVTQRIASFPQWHRSSNISFETFGLIGQLSPLLSMTFIIPYLIRDRD